MTNYNDSLARNTQSFLDGVSFPCGRAELVQKAKSNEATADFISELESLRDERYYSMDEVVKTLVRI